MNHTTLRLEDPEGPTASREEIHDCLTPALMRELCGLCGAGCEEANLQRQLGKALSRYQAAVISAAGPKEEPQTREFKNFQKAAARFLKTIDALSAANREKVDFEILSRPPFNSRFFFPQQLDYWAANEKSMKRMRDLVERTAWASEVAVRKSAAEREIYNPTRNTPLDHLIQDLSIYYEMGAEQGAPLQCYYSASLENYTGQFYDFVVLILDRFAPSSYHSRAALGQRIKRVLAKRA